MRPGFLLKVCAVGWTLSMHAPAVDLHCQELEWDNIALLQIPTQQRQHRVQNGPEAIPMHMRRATATTAMVPPVMMTASFQRMLGYMPSSFLHVANDMAFLESVPVNMRVAAASTAASIFTTVNDIFWFLPFALHVDRWRFLGVYMMAKEVTVLAAWFLVGMTEQLGARFPGVPLQNLFYGFGACFLCAYAVMLFLEDRRSSAKDEILQQSAEDTPRLKQAQLLTASKVAIISTFGNIDSLGIFVPGLQQDLFSLPSLLVGTALVSCLMGALCIGFGQLLRIDTIVDCMPLWFILLLLAVWSAIEACLV